MGKHFDRVASLFSRARRLSVREREGFLLSACGTDAALRSEVEDLLRAHDAVPDTDEVHPLAAALPGLAAGVLEDVDTSAETLPTLDGFRVLHRLAEGGMGTVYVAEQENPRRLVALKVLRPEAATPEGRQRFEREAAVLARLEHPGIARIHVYGTTTGPGTPRPFLAMELVRGDPLTSATATMDLRARVAVLAEVAEAVAHAHEKGVIHRDLKPDNILVPSNGRPKIVDFGVARLIDDRWAVRTRAGHVIGTLAYMSPEQARGDTDDVDTRSDGYALGVVAYEVLCARHPLGDRHGTYTQIVRRILEESPPDAGTVNPRLRGDLSRILAKALAKEPAQRYGSATGLAEDLRRHLRDEPILARPPTGRDQVRRFLRRHKALVAASAVGLTALVVGLALALWFAHDERRARLRADQSASRLERALAERSIELAATSLRDHEVDGAARHLEEVPPELRAWEWRYLAAAMDDSIAWAPLVPGPLAEVRMGTAPGSWLARGSDGSLHVAAGEDAAPRRLVVPRGHEIRTLASLGATLLAALQDGDSLTVLDDDGTTRLRCRLPTGRVVQAIAGTEDGRRLAVAQHGEEGACPLCVLDAATGREIWRTEGSETETTALAFSPDGRLLAAGGGSDGVVHVFDPGPRGKPPLLLRGHTGGVTALCFSADGRRIASGSKDRTARLWDVATGREVRRFTGHRSAVLAVAFSPRGERLATTGRDGTVRVWGFGRDAPPQILSGHRGAVHAVRFVEKGGALVTLGDDGRRRWRLDDEPYVLRVHRGPEEGNLHPYVYNATFSPDGRRIASVGWDGTVRIVDAPSGELLQTLPVGEPPVLDVRWSLDGRGLVGVGDGHTLIGWDAQTGVERVRRRMSLNVDCLCMAADGEHFLSAGHGGVLRLHRLEDLEPVAEWTTGPTTIYDLHATKDGTRVATITERGQVDVRTLPGGELLWQRGAHARGRFGAVAFSPDGRRLATGGADRRIRIWDAQTGVEQRALEGHRDAVLALAWLPDGSRLFSADNRGMIRVWDPLNGHLCLELGGHQGYVYRLDVSPDGTTLASASGDNTVRLWSTLPRAAREGR